MYGKEHIITGFGDLTCTGWPGMKDIGTHVLKYVFGGFDGAKRNDIYRILFDEEERRRNLQDYEMKQLARSCSLMNLSMDDAMMGGHGDEMGSAAHSDLQSNHH